MTGKSHVALLADRTFGPFLAGKIVSVCGMWVQNIAAAVLMFELTESAFMVGAVSMAMFAGPLLLSLYTGALSDRIDRRKLLMAGRVVSGTVVGVLGLTIVLRGQDGAGGAAGLLATMLLVGIGVALSAPAMQALVPSLVSDEDLEQALALGSAAPSIARTVGPALGAAFLVFGGPGLAFLVAAASHWVFVFALLFIRPLVLPVSRPRASLLGGLRHVWRDRPLLLLMVGVAAVAFGADPAITLTPPLADALGGGSEMVGIIASAFGLGAVVGTVTMRSVRNRLSLQAVGVAGFCLMAAGMCVAAAAVSIAGAAIGFSLAGTGFMVTSVSLTTRIHRRVPEHLRGRVMALWTIAFLGSRPLAAFVSGGLAEIASVRVALVGVGVLMLLASRLVYRGSESVVPRESHAG